MAFYNPGILQPFMLGYVYTFNINYYYILTIGLPRKRQMIYKLVIRITCDNPIPYGWVVFVGTNFHETGQNLCFRNFHSFYFYSRWIGVKLLVPIRNSGLVSSTASGTAKCECLELPTERDGNLNSLFRYTIVLRLRVAKSHPKYETMHDHYWCLTSPQVPSSAWPYV